MPNKYFYNYDLKNTVSILDEIIKKYGVSEITFRRDIAFGIRGTKPTIETLEKIKDYYDAKGFDVLYDDAISNKVQFLVNHNWYRRLGII